MKVSRTLINKDMFDSFRENVSIGLGHLVGFPVLVLRNIQVSTRIDLGGNWGVILSMMKLCKSGDQQDKPVGLLRSSDDVAKRSFYETWNLLVHQSA